MNKKARHITLILISAVCLIALFCTLFFILLKDNSAEEHKIKNSLKENIDIVPFYSQGNLLAYKNGEVITLAQNVYDTTSAEPLYSADYAMDKDGNIVYVSDNKLYLNKDGNTKLLISNVIAWRVNNDFSRIAFITNTIADATIGNLYVFDGEVKILDTNVLTTSMRFSNNGEILYAQKKNLYPKTKYMLLEYKDGNGEVKLEECDELKLVLDNAFIFGRQSGELSQYTVFSANFKKSVQIDKTFYPSVSENGKKIFFLKNYTYPQECGTLVSIDAKTLKQTEIASQVSLFSSDVVTNSNQGIVYTRADGNETFSIFYKSFSNKKEVRLIRQADESAIYNVAVNTDKKTAFILTTAPRRIDSAIYHLDFSGETVSKKIASGYVDSLTYYEEFDKVTFVLDPETDAFTYLIDKDGNKTEICQGVATAFDNTLRKFSAKSVLIDNEGASVYFCAQEKDANKCKMYLIKDGKQNLLAENVLTEEFFVPIIQRDAKKIFYCAEQDGKVNLYLYSETGIECIAKEIDGIVNL